MALFAIANFSGFYAMRPFLVQILKAYGTPISPNKASVSDRVVVRLSLCMAKCTNQIHMLH